MSKSNLSYRYRDLPDEIPVFPLSGVILLPHGQLPLNIFEPRYLAMIDTALCGDRIIGMVQPENMIERITPDTAALHQTGCAGRITAFEETGDGRYLVTLSGICRFSIAEELPMTNGFRRIRPEWAAYACDLAPDENQDFDRGRLLALLKDYFSLHKLNCDWERISQTSNEKLIAVLSMICPLDPLEKQALLESPCCCNRAHLFMDMMEIALHKKKVTDNPQMAH
ncbi:MAG: LON peptidase substrate-binding domain-containing protein [Rhodospirillales bacterium]|nr:LON peptidase substrate-binding domain-containing protein [Rhodospirillales bacterium]